MLSTAFVNVFGTIIFLIFLPSLIITTVSNNDTVLRVSVIMMYASLAVCFAVGLVFWCGTLIGLGVIFVALLTLFSHVF